MPHIHHFYDFTVNSYITFDNKVLLVNHPKYGKWIAPGGHVELHEDPEEALYREVAEETGLEIEVINKKPDYTSPGTKPLITPNYLDTHEANLPHRHIALIYFCKAKSGNFVKSGEHSDMRWVSLSELTSDELKLDNSVIYYATKALEASQ